MTELLTAAGEFERKPHREIEKKYLPVFPESLNDLRAEAMPIEQLYLSHPSEPFSLRLRETFRDGELVYTAALKDRGQITVGGLDRLEVETPISADAYLYYKRSAPHAALRKLRAEPSADVAIDWYEDGHVHLEAEDHMAWVKFCMDQGVYWEQAFVDITGDRICDNEWRAHLEYRRLHDGEETLRQTPELRPEDVVEKIALHQTHNNQTVVTISGRSGSGKSTIVRQTQELLRQRGVESVVLSTDDYHRGKTWLEHYKGGPWTDWDAPIVYDLEALHADMCLLREGRTVPQRVFDFETEEPALTGLVESAPVILIEGIYARDSSFEATADLRLDVGTPLATCVGRRLLRDLRERPQFAEPERSLRYMLEQAEPAYQKVDKS